MRTTDLFVVCKPSEQKDSMGGDLPWQSYSYLSDMEGRRRTCNLNDALILDQTWVVVVRRTLGLWPGYRIINLADAIKQEEARAVDIATLPVACGLTACLEGIGEEDYGDPRRPIYLAVKAAINDLEQRPIQQPENPDV